MRKGVMAIEGLENEPIASTDKSTPPTPPVETAPKEPTEPTPKPSPLAVGVEGVEAPAADPAVVDPAAPPAATEPVGGEGAPLAAPGGDTPPDLGDDTTDGLPAVSDIPVVIDESTDDIGEQVNRIEEGEGIADVVDTYVDVLEESVDRGEGVDDSTATAISASLEHFYKRLSYVRQGTPGVGLEGFTVPQSRLKKTKAALEELKLFRKLLTKGLKVAQEGLETAVDNHIETTGDASEKVTAELDKTSQQFEDKGAKKDAIEGGDWSAALGTFEAGGGEGAEGGAPGGGLILPEAVLKRVEEIAAAVDAAKLSETVKEESSLEDKLAKLKEVAAAVKKITGEGGSSDAKFAALTEKEKDPIVNAAKKIAAELAAFATGWDNLEEPKEAPKEIPKEGETAEEAPATKTDNSALQQLVELNGELTKLCVAVNEYVEKSTT